MMSLSPIRRVVPTALGAFLLIAAARPAAAAYVVFQDGRSLKVQSYKFVEGETEVDLQGGGAIKFSSEVGQFVAPDEDVEGAVASGARARGGEAQLAIEDGWISYADPSYVDAIRASSSRHGVDPGLVAAVIRVESDFRPHALSPKGAMGLMQLMPATAKEMAVEDPFDPEANIEGGTTYLKNLLDRYQGDLEKALAAYNAGARAVDYAQGVPAFAETRQYVTRVLALAGHPTSAFIVK
jgi:soluble lytic murein transglycosylase-like protein